MLSKRKKPVVLVVLDGWGIAPAWGGNAISQAKTRNFDMIWQHYPRTELHASGEFVGLPQNSQGNSEAGHLNIGAGHIVKQDAGLIDAQIENGSFFKNQAILGAIEHSRKNNSKLNLIGLMSKTKTHSDIGHLYALLRLCKEKDFKNVHIHLFSDGRDSDPMSGIEVAEEIENKIKEIGVGEVASLSGRFFAMDRDNRWGRISRAYNMLVKSEGERFPTLRAAFSKAYASGMTDEFIEPRIINSITKEATAIEDNDAVIFFNFRSDRAKEITEAFLADKVDQFPDRKKLKNLYFASFLIYQDGIPGHQAFRPEIIAQPLAKVWSDKGLSQFHIAETEKYPHVTYFINGGVERPFNGEDHQMIPSPKNFKTYDLCPEMSAGEVTSKLLLAIKKNTYDCFIVNFANADMVGHSGSLSATVKAVEFIDKCIGRIMSEILNLDGTAFFVGDHGNAEQMVSPETGKPDTEHSTNPVPFILFSNSTKDKLITFSAGGNLSSVAPTILDFMGIEKPESMSAKSLINR